MRRTLGTAVFSGMLGVTLFGIFLTPVFYYVIQWASDVRPSAASATLCLSRLSRTDTPIMTNPTNGHSRPHNSDDFDGNGDIDGDSDGVIHSPPLTTQDLFATEAEVLRSDGSLRREVAEAIERPNSLTQFAGIHQRRLSTYP